MAGTFTVNGANTTINLSYTAPTANVLAIATAAANNLWNRGLGNHGTEDIPILFASLTNQQKLDILDAYVRQGLLDLANAYNIQTAKDAASKATPRLNI